MIRAKNLHETLRAALGTDLTSAMLVTDAGGLLAAAHVDPSFLRSKEHSLMIATVVNVWRNYSNTNTTTLNFSEHPQPENLEFLLLQLELRNLCVMSAGSGAVLCLEAKPQLELGLLKLKAATLRAFLEPQLRPVLSNTAVPTTAS